MTPGLKAGWLTGSLTDKMQVSVWIFKSNCSFKKTFCFVLSRNNVILIVPMRLRLVFQKTIFKGGCMRAQFWQKPYETWLIPTIKYYRTL